MMMLMFLMLVLAFLFATWGVVYIINILVKYDTIHYDMEYLWMEQEFSKEDFDYNR